MSCHKDSEGNKKHSNLKHMLHMIICCGLPIVIIGFLPVIWRFSPEAGRVLSVIAPFLCPIMMISMIPMMFGKGKRKSCCDNKEELSKLSKPMD